SLISLTSSSSGVYCNFLFVSGSKREPHPQLEARPRSPRRTRLLWPRQALPLRGGEPPPSRREQAAPGGAGHPNPNCASCHFSDSYLLKLGTRPGCFSPALPHLTLAPWAAAAALPVGAHAPRRSRPRLLAPSPPPHLRHRPNLGRLRTGPHRRQGRHRRVHPLPHRPPRPRRRHVEPEPSSPLRHPRPHLPVPRPPRAHGDADPLRHRRSSTTPPYATTCNNSRQAVARKRGADSRPRSRPFCNSSSGCSGTSPRST